MRFVTAALLSFASFCLGENDTSPIDMFSNLANLAENNTLFTNLEYHTFPAVWRFEVEQDFTDDDSVLAEVEEAFILAANEVHDKKIIRFISVSVQGVSLEEAKYFHPLVGRTKDEEDERPNNYHIRSRSKRLNTHHIRRKRLRSRPIWRVHYTSHVSVGCSNCNQGPEDSTAMMVPTPFDQVNKFYLNNAGRAILIKWQIAFCKRLKRIKHMKNPDRCFVQMEFDQAESEVLLMRNEQ